MPVVNIVQPTYLAVIDRETLNDSYEAVCAFVGFNPIDGGFGVLLALRADLSRVTMVSLYPQIIRDLAALSGPSRDGLAIPEGGFPLAHDGWIDLPPQAIIARHGMLAVFGPPDYALGLGRPVYLIRYYRDGVEAETGFADAGELDLWRTDLTAAGWVVDDRLALDPHGAIVRRGASLAERLRRRTTPLPGDYHQIGASIIEAAGMLVDLADAGEAPTSPAYAAAAGALGDALANHDAYPAARRPV